MGSRPRKAYSVQVPGRMWQPLLGPAPVIIVSRHRITLHKGNSIFILASRRDAIENSARSVRIFIGIEEQISRVAMAAPHEHAHVERVSAQNPMQLVPA